MLELEPRRRFGEPLKFIPVIFVWLSILLLYTVYVVAHCIPLLQLGEDPLHLDEGARWRGKVELIVFNIFTVLLMISYVRCILVHPGTVPDNDPQWDYLAQANQAKTAEGVLIQETKRSGDRRHCKWCGKYKPDRCHHCRVCRVCILKMDHHCPWIYNCVGYHNYKFFFLILFYSVLDCHFIVWTMAESVRSALDSRDTPLISAFIILFAETLAFFLGFLVTMFFGFHIWLMLKAMTTIEFCEKSIPRKGDSSQSPAAPLYDLGLYGNVSSVLGHNPLLWLFPVAAGTGDGLNFVTEETRMYVADPEAGYQGSQQRDSRSRSKSVTYGGTEGF
mmetsp:Transcript_23510/g.52034  ORF Transcript_23510/g.52034 Transcript_23510/m.52034 type:complete len:333 (-) Transcript_23510:147-1145(-)|eukprot:CAMPEP_0170601190 /NCGR_PEP_ID=MMETSP0224-20130122/17728_1 /TAXON_ID=285029 /ORGANISM="Togula jolla, Strain CCCM 725" /LENGTH=332 /DNA_ID=CAMNT_0010925951 /DNA_START=97 /DNA_END=1095 /DNA_ORIENTATION=+